MVENEITLIPSSLFSVDQGTLQSWREPVNFIPVNGDITEPPPLEKIEVKNSIYRLRCRKLPGIDGISGEMVKAILKVIPDYLESAFRKCFTEGRFPCSWKMARIIVLPRSYRGISCHGE